MSNDKFVYPYSRADAKRSSELDIYDQSHRENMRCADFIEQSIRDNYDGAHLKQGSAKEIIDNFGFDRVNFVLANTINQMKSDGRISKENKEWAKNIFVPKDKSNGIDYNSTYKLDSDAGLVNLYTNQAKREYSNLQLFDSSHCIEQGSIDFTNKIMVLDPFNNLSDEYKSPNDQLVFCTSGFGCSPTSVGRKVFGNFLNDDSKCQYDRSDFIGELKEEHYPDWLKQKLEDIKQESQVEIDTPTQNMEQSM